MPDRALGGGARTGLRVLVVGGSGRLGETVVGRLTRDGHRIAVSGPGARADHPIADDHGGARTRPVLLAGDRSDPGSIAGVAAAAEAALEGLEAVVILPDHVADRVGLDADPASWSDAWSRGLASGVLAVASVAHAAAHVLARRPHPGRIVLVTDAGSADGAPCYPATAITAAVTALATGLRRELERHGVAVSVISGGGAGAECTVHVADLVAAMVSGPASAAVDVQAG